MVLISQCMAFSHPNQQTPPLPYTNILSLQPASLWELSCSCSQRIWVRHLAAMRKKHVLIIEQATAW
jgi:hypothetical protein